MIPFILYLHLLSLQEDDRDHDFVKKVIATINNHKPKPKPADASDPVIKTDGELKASSAVVATVSEFALALNSWSAAHGITNAAVNDLLGILRDSIPDIQLPLNAKDKKPYSAETIQTNAIKKYVSIDLKDFSVDICRRECMVFQGKQTIVDENGETRSIDCSTLMHCEVCKDARFTKCCHKTCAKNGTGFDCNPFKGGHSETYRVAMKGAHFRSVIVKLIQLYCLSLMEGFEGILDYNNRRIKKKGKIIDILDGVEVKRQQRKMRDRFKEVSERVKEQGIDEVHECSLILTAFYDGVVNFKRKADSMWPLMFSVANCNPSHRSKIGLGLFLSLLHNISIGSGAEKYLIEQMLTKELVKLENGIFFTIPGKDGAADRNVLLQARLVFAHLDTKALEKFACIKMCGSKTGCGLCNMQRGCWRGPLRKVKYGDTRSALHRRHVYRSMGQREFENDVLDPLFPDKILRTALEKARLYYSGAKDYNDYIDQE